MSMKIQFSLHHKREPTEIPMILLRLVRIILLPKPATWLLFRVIPMRFHIAILLIRRRAWTAIYSHIHQLHQRHGARSTEIAAQVHIITSALLRRERQQALWRDIIPFRKAGLMQDCVSVQLPRGLLSNFLISASVISPTRWITEVNQAATARKILSIRSLIT